MAKLFELRKLSKEFYKDFPRELFPEMIFKEGRPYIVLLVRINDIKFAIPLRTNIRHSYCYKFKKSDRKSDSSTGVDFTKAIIILKESYLGDKTDINDKEFLELKEKVAFIIQKFKKYVNNYIKFAKSGGNEYLIKRYAFSTLKYFDDLLLK